MTKTIEVQTIYEIRATNGKEIFLVNEGVNVDGYIPEEFQCLTGRSREELDQAHETGTTVFLEGFDTPFTVERSTTTAAELARDEAFADSPEAQELLKLINEAQKNGTLGMMAGKYKH